MDKKVAIFIKAMKSKKLTLALAESITCGLAAHKLSTCPGTSEVLKGSIVCYTPEVKHHLLGVPQHLMDTHSCESAQVTEALAKKLPGLIKADVYAAITGLASAGGSETKTKPVGTVFFALWYQQKVFKLRKVFRGTPLTIRKKACMELYDFILEKTKA